MIIAVTITEIITILLVVLLLLILCWIRLWCIDSQPRGDHNKSQLAFQL